MINDIFVWTVVGAGPAGILAIAKLIGSGINPQRILWIDPNFNVGDFGNKWQPVSGNTTVSTFIRSLEQMKLVDFSYQNFDLFKFDPSQTCQLVDMYHPLLYATSQLKQHITTKTASVSYLNKEDDSWKVSFGDGSAIQSKSVILATGSDPWTLPLESETQQISLDTALDPEHLKNVVDVNDAVAVFGASHSAILILKNLIELDIAHVHNFYLHPCRYAMPVTDWTLYDNTGLKGKAAEWAKQYIDGTQPEKLSRHLSNNDNITKFLPQCSKRIDATGFKRKQSFHVENINLNEYDTHSGIIAKGLYGLGIAFPEKITDPLGHKELNVGIWKFADYLNRIFPVWHAYSEL